MKKLDRVVLVVLLAHTGTMLIIWAFDLGMNFTESAPTGIWTKKPIQSISKGTLVVFCAPPSDIPMTHGDCPDTFNAPLLKPVAAVAGDTVKISRGLPATVNGHALPNTAAHPSMKAWPDGEYIVRDGQVWLFSSYSPKSFDSRYFGPVNLSAVRGEAVPLLVWGDTAAMTRGHI